MKIYVRSLQTGEITQIEEDSFRDDLHEVVDAETAATIEAADEVSNFEQALQARDDRVREQTMNTILGALSEQGLGEERPTPAIRQTASLETEAARSHRQGRVSTPAFGAARAVPGSDARYRGVPFELGGDVRNAEGDKEIKTFLNALATKDHDTLARLERKARADYKRANEMLIGATDADSGLAADASGGRLVPLPLSSLISTILQRNATMRQISQMFSSDAETLRVVIQTAHVAPAWYGENATIVNARPEYTSKLLIKKKMAFITPVSSELLSDSAFNVSSLISQDAAQSMADEEDTQFATSDGTGGQPTEGLDTFADTLSASHAITPLGVGMDEVSPTHLNNMFFSVHKPYRRLGVWVASDDVLKILSGIADADGRQVLNFRDSPINVVTDQYPGAIGTIFNRPVVEAPVAAGRLYFGDIRRAYMILDSGGVSAMASEHAGFEEDVVKFRFIKRVDGRGGNGGLTTKRTFVYSTGITTASLATS